MRDHLGRTVGEQFAARLHEAARWAEVALRVRVQPSFQRRSSLVTVGWGPPEAGHELDCEVSERWDAVHLLDLDRAEVTMQQALAYVVARAQGTPAADALLQVRPPRRRWWTRD